jgi:hypothetical protein
MLLLVLTKFRKEARVVNRSLKIIQNRCTRRPLDIQLKIRKSSFLPQQPGSSTKEGNKVMFSPSPLRSLVRRKHSLIGQARTSYNKAFLEPARTHRAAQEGAFPSRRLRLFQQPGNNMRLPNIFVLRSSGIEALPSWLVINTCSRSSMPEQWFSSSKKLHSRPRHPSH